MHLNAEFRRIAKRDMKGFLSGQCKKKKKKEESSGMGKARDIFQKIGDAKGILHAKISTIKDRNGMGLTEAEDN